MAIFNSYVKLPEGRLIDMMYLHISTIFQPFHVWNNSWDFIFKLISWVSSFFCWPTDLQKLAIKPLNPWENDLLLDSMDSRHCLHQRGVLLLRLLHHVPAVNCGSRWKHGGIHMNSPCSQQEMGISWDLYRLYCGMYLESENSSAIGHLRMIHVDSSLHSPSFQWRHSEVTIINSLCICHKQHCDNEWAYIYIYIYSIYVYIQQHDDMNGIYDQ